MSEVADFLRCASCEGIIDAAAGYFDVIARQPMSKHDRARVATAPAIIRPVLLHFCSLIHLIAYAQKSLPLDGTRAVNHVVILCDWCKDEHFGSPAKVGPGYPHPCNQVECQCWCVT